MGVSWKCATCMHLNMKIIHLSGVKSEFHVYISLNIIEVGELIFHKQISPISRGIRFVSGFLSIWRSLTSCIPITLVLLSTLPIGTKYVTEFQRENLNF